MNLLSLISSPALTKLLILVLLFHITPFSSAQSQSQSQSQFQSQQCYTPSGLDRNARDNLTATSNPYIPCNSTAPPSHSMCCRTTDTCLPSGLCRANTGTVWRESCTDATWVDAARVKLYITDNYKNPDSKLPISQSDVSLRECDDGSWCLGSKNQTCCAGKEGFWVVNGTVSAVKASDGGDKATTATESTSTSKQTQTQQDSSAGSGYSAADTVAIIGGVVGGLLCLGLIAGVIAFVILRNRRRRNWARGSDASGIGGEEDGKSIGTSDMASKSDVSGLGREVLHELSNRHPPAELADRLPVAPQEMPTH